ncbi:uncharacterized protein LOC143859364 [Tasmannia lanceolata]|uniref:uncharacterized protein LOC143859364 n=1 Tax=Tasmannia lanceolata TaxID=3420 RepID=UPI0040627CBB
MLSWNVNGLGSLAKRAQVKGLVKKIKPELICIQETKLGVIDRNVIKSLGGSLEWGFSFVGAIGASGGILIAWDESSWVLSEEWKGRFSISIVLRRVVDAALVLFSGVYGPSLWADKGLLWGELNRVRDRWAYPWCIGGDFNEIRFVGERFGCRRSNQNMVAFADFISNHDLIDLPMTGARFTWNRGDSHSRIDRFLICPCWMNLAPEVYQKALIHSVSDHCPLFLDPRLESWGPPPFRFEIAWLQLPHMEKRLGEWWASVQVPGPADVVIGQKLRHVKKKLKEWVAERRLVDSNRKVWLECRIEELATLEESGLGNVNSREELGRVKEEHKGLLLHEEITWRQKSRVRWLKEGDKNSAYFHALASARRRKNRIEYLEDNGIKVSGKDEVTNVILNFYTSLYSSEGISRPLPEDLLFSELSMNQL